MVPARAGSLFVHLAQVPDPRGRKGRRHTLSAMLTAVVCGLLCGVRGYVSLVEWLHDLPVDIWHFMGFTRRPPKQDCFRDLLMKLDPEALDAALRSWVTEDLQLPDAADSLPAVSIDGKTLCGTLRAFTKAVHLLAAVDHQTGYVLSQLRVDEKTNEHKAALELLKSLVLKGRVLVGDAMFCQRDLCQQVLDSGGDYFLPVKENQPELLREIEQEFAAQPAAFSPYGQLERQSERQTASTLDKGHGRIERRTLVSTTGLNLHLDWPGVKQVGRIERRRKVKGRIQTETVYFVSSLSRSRADAAQLLALGRRHWDVTENGLHYVRDTTFDEDRCTIFRGHAPQNLAAFRNTALNWIRHMKFDKIAATIRRFTRQSQRLFSILGHLK